MERVKLLLSEATTDSREGKHKEAYFKYVAAMYAIFDLLSNLFLFSEEADGRQPQFRPLETENASQLFVLCRVCLEKTEKELEYVIDIDPEEAEKLQGGETGEMMKTLSVLVGAVEPSNAFRASIHGSGDKNHPPNALPSISTEDIPLIPTSKLALVHREAVYNLQLLSQRMDILRESPGKSKSTAFYLNTLRRLMESVQLVQQRKSKISAAITLTESWQCVNDLAPLELAQQITLIDFGIFKRIEPEELYNCAWTKAETRRKTSPNVVASVDFFNYLTHWVQLEALMASDEKDRATAIVQLIKIAGHLSELCSYNALKAVLAGLLSTPVRRLRKTLAMVPGRSRTIFENLALLMSESKNYGRLRKILSKEPKPAVPFLGLYLHDLVYVDAAQSSGVSVSEEGMRKLKGCLDQIGAFQECKKYEESLKLHLPIQHWLLSRPYKTTEELFSLSKEREPLIGAGGKADTLAVGEAANDRTAELFAEAEENDRTETEMPGAVTDSEASEMYERLQQRFAVHLRVDSL